MGFFDRFFGGAKPEAPPASDDWATKFASFGHQSARQQSVVMEEVLSHIGKQLGDGAYHHAPNDGRGEWRTTLAGHPMRLTLDGGALLEGMVKAPNPHGEITLRWDPEIVETQPEEVWSDDDEVRIFVGKKVFFSQPGWLVEQYLPQYEGLPNAALQPLIDAMPIHRVERLAIEDAEISWRFEERLDALRNPLAPEVVASNVGWCQLVGQATAQLASIPVDAGKKQAEESSVHSLVHTCGYCHSRFLLVQGRCPNCGAPAN